MGGSSLSGAAALALDRAFRDGDLDAIRALLGDPEGFPNVSAGDAFGSCLAYAVYHGPVSLVSTMLELGADPNVDDGDGYPPLIAALTGGSAPVDVRRLVELLLAHGADVDRRGVNGYSPLHVAAEQGDLAMVDLLVSHGADPNVITNVDDMETPVEVASAAGHVDVVERLRPLTVRLDWESASRAGDVAILDRLLDAGQDVDATDGYSQTALMRAAHAGRVEAVTLLIKHGADLDRTAKFGLTALMLAVIQGHDDVARALVAAGADRALPDSRARPPPTWPRTAATAALLPPCAHPEGLPPPDHRSPRPRVADRRVRTETTVADGSHLVVRDAGSRGFEAPAVLQEGRATRSTEAGRWS